MAKLDFPSNPTVGQDYHFTPFTYRWDGEKWKTLGRGSSTIDTAINDHKADPKAHNPVTIGAYPITAGDLKGRMIVRNPLEGGDPISLIQKFNPSGANAQGISGYNSTDETRRAWSVGAYSESAVVSYAYLGVGASPWANGLRVYSDRALFNQQLSVEGKLSINNASNEAITLNYPSGSEGSHVRGRQAGELDWYVGRANVQGHVALYSNKLSNGMVIRDGEIEMSTPLRIGSAGHVYFNQHASTTDLNTLSSLSNVGFYYQDANSNATPTRNYPIAEAGTLLVTGSAYGVQQEYTAFSSNRKFVRGKGGAGSTNWYPWKEVGGPKHHLSGYRMQITNITAGGTALLIPQIFPSNFGIDSAGGSGIFNIYKTAVYEISFGFSIEPQGAVQQGIGTILVNDVVKFDALNYNYCPASSTAVQLGTSSTSVISSLTAGDKLKFRIQAVNNTTVRLYQSGFITIKELY